MFLVPVHAKMLEDVSVAWSNAGLLLRANMPSLLPTPPWLPTPC